MSKVYYEFLIRIIELFPDTEPLEVPEGLKGGFKTMFDLLGFFFPYELFSPLLYFIVTLTFFRISWSVFITFKK